MARAERMPTAPTRFNFNELRSTDVLRTPYYNLDSNQLDNNHGNTLSFSSQNPFSIIAQIVSFLSFNFDCLPGV